MPLGVAYIGNTILDFLDIVRSTLILIFESLLVVLTTIVALLTTFRALSFLIISLTLLGLALMPIVENQQQIVLAANDVTDDLRIFVNQEIIFKYINPLLLCLDSVWEVWNRVVLIVESIIWRAGKEFDFVIFPHAAYTSDFDFNPFFRAEDAFPHLRTNVSESPLLSPNEIHLIEEWTQMAMSVQSMRDHRQDSVEMEMRSRLLAYKIYRHLHYPYMENRDIIGFLNTFCSTLETVLETILEIADLVVEFLLFLYDIVEELVEKIIDGDFDFEFVVIVVEAIIDIFLLIIDQKGCFRNFPTGFPQTVFPCFCGGAYDTVEDVPENILLALVYCVCPPQEVGDNPGVIEVLQECVNYPFLRRLLDLLQIAIAFLEFLLNSAQEIVNRIRNIINKIRRIIEKIFDFLREEVRFNTRDGDEVFVQHYDDGDYTIFQLILSNTTQKMSRIHKEARVVNYQWFTYLFSQLDRGDRMIRDSRSSITASPAMLMTALEDLDETHRISAEKSVKLGHDIANWMKPQIEELKHRNDRPSFFDSAYWQSRDAGAPAGSTFFADILNHHLHLTFAQLIDKHSNQSRWEGLVRAAPHICGDECVDDVRQLTFFGAEMAGHMSRFMKDDRSTLKRDALKNVEFGAARRALSRTVQRIREHRRMRYGDEWPLRSRFIKTAGECGHTAIRALAKPWMLPEIVREVSPQSAENVLGWLEKKSDLLDRMKTAPSIHAARHMVAEEIRLFHGAKTVEVAREVVGTRFVPVIVISISVIGGGAAIIAISVAGAAAVVVTALLPLIIILLAALFIIFFNLLVVIGGSQTTIFFTGEVNQPDVFLPLVTLFEESLGSIFQNGFDSINTSSLKDQLFLIAEADGWYLVVETLRTLLGILPWVGKPPGLLYDPNSGLALGDLTSWFFNIINCDPEEACSIPGAYGGADCRCIEGDVGRYATVENPCAPGTGKYHCYPFVALSTQLQGFQPLSLPFDCEEFGYATDGYLWGTTRIPSMIGTWLDTDVRVAKVLVRRLLTGWSLPAIGIFAGLVMGFCPCFKPISGLMWKFTLISILFSPVFQFIVGDYIRSIVKLNDGFLSPITSWLDSWVTDEPLQDYEGQCAWRYSPPLFVSTGLFIIVFGPILLSFLLGGFFVLIHLLAIVWMILKIILRFFLYLFIAVTETENTRASRRPAMILEAGQLAIGHSMREHNEFVQRLKK